MHVAVHVGRLVDCSEKAAALRVLVADELHTHPVAQAHLAQSRHDRLHTRAIRPHLDDRSLAGARKGAQPQVWLQLLLRHRPPRALLCRGCCCQGSIIWTRPLLLLGLVADARRRGRRPLLLLRPRLLARRAAHGGGHTRERPAVLPNTRGYAPGGLLEVPVVPLDGWQHRSPRGGRREPGVRRAGGLSWAFEPEKEAAAHRSQSSAPRARWMGCCFGSWAGPLVRSLGYVCEV